MKRPKLVLDSLTGTAVDLYRLKSIWASAGSKEKKIYKLIRERFEWSWIFKDNNQHFSCNIFLKFRCPPLCSIVGLLLANKFNQLVYMDLKEYMHNESQILHLIDAATRYSAASIVKTKKYTILENIYCIWIAYFGCSHKFLIDNGGAFSNDNYRQMNEKLHVETNKCWLIAV